MPLHDRLTVLDVLRGIAILGTLGTNIWIFMYPGGLLGYLETGWGQSDGMHWGVLALQQMTQGKFLGLLALMFGMGIALQQRSAIAAGIRWPGPYLVRAALLFVDGVLKTLSENAPLAIANSKTIIEEYVKASGVPDHKAMDAAIDRCARSADYEEGRRAFMEKRKPKFQGK